jgi:hypothetical protein
MKCCIKEALSGESYTIPSFTEVHARYHFRRGVLASCCPTQVAWRKPSCRDVRSGTCRVIPSRELIGRKLSRQKTRVIFNVKTAEADLFLDSLSITSNHHRR